MNMKEELEAINKVAEEHAGIRYSEEDLRIYKKMKQVIDELELTEDDIQKMAEVEGGILTAEDIEAIVKA